MRGGEWVVDSGGGGPVDESIGVEVFDDGYGGELFVV